MQTHEPVENGSILGKPGTIDSCYTLHVLLGSHDQLVIDDIVGCVSHSVQRARWMQPTRHARSQVHVLRETLQRTQSSPRLGKNCH